MMSAAVGQRACHAHHFLSLGLLEGASPLDDTQDLSVWSGEGVSWVTQAFWEPALQRVLDKDS